MARVPVWIGAEKSRRPPGFDPRTVQPVASCYTYYAIPAHLLYGRFSENRYDLKFCCSYVSCRSATCSRALTKKFIHVREVILESGLRNGQELSPLSAEYKRVLAIRGPFNKQARLPLVFHRFSVFCFIQHNRNPTPHPLRWSCIADCGVRCDAVTRVVFCMFNERNILFTKIHSVIYIPTGILFQAF